jgi:class III cytochrome C family protein
MNKLAVIFVSILLIATFGSTFVIAKQKGSSFKGTLCIPFGILTLNPPQTVKSPKAAVEFPHGVHFGYSCKTCHHKWDGIAELQTCKTSGCHDAVKPVKRPLKHLEYTGEGIKYFKYAYHQQCIGCHKEINGKNTKMLKQVRVNEKNVKLLRSGPVGCVECHPEP